MPDRRVGHPPVQSRTHPRGVGQGQLHADVRPVAAPQQVLRPHLDECADPGGDRLLVPFPRLGERGATGYHVDPGRQEPLQPGQRHPDLVLGEQFQHQAHGGVVDPDVRRQVPEVVEDHRHRAAAHGVAEPLEVPADVGPDLDVPAQGRHRLADLDEGLDWDAAGVAVLHARTADACGVHLGQLVRRGARRHARHTAQHVGPGPQRGEQAAVVVAVGTGLDQHPAVAAGGPQMFGVVVHVHGGRLVGGPADEPGHVDAVGDEDVAVGIDTAHGRSSGGSAGSSPVRVAASSASTGRRWVRNRG